MWRRWRAAWKHQRTTCARRGFTGGNLAAARALLGCRAQATKEEVKDAFRRAALRVHPDLRGGDPQERAAASQEFLELAAAARLLLHERKQREEKRWPDEREGTGDDTVTLRRDDTIDSFLRQALETVKYGPPMRIDEDDMFPDQFEMEERNVGSNELPILKLVHGRTPFGFVEEYEQHLIGTVREHDAPIFLKLSLFGSVVATAVRRCEGDVVETTVVRENTEPVTLVSPARQGATLFGLGGFTTHDVKTAAGTTTHRLVESVSPGVANMLWHVCRDDAVPKGVYHPRDVVVTCSRAWFPSHHFWFPFFAGSRSEGFANDGRASAFYVERKPSRYKSRFTESLHPRCDQRSFGSSNAYRYRTNVNVVSCRQPLRQQKKESPVNREMEEGYPLHPSKGECRTTPMSRPAEESSAPPPRSPFAGACQGRPRLDLALCVFAAAFKSLAREHKYRASY